MVVIPFVCKKKPFIGIENMATRPNICVFIPYVENRRRDGGFSLIELMITLVVAVIFLAAATPSFTQIVQANKLTTQVNDFLGDLSFARSEAIKRAANVGVCAGTYAGGCTGTWNGGRIVFVDADGNNAWTAGEMVIRSSAVLESGYAITASTVTPSATILIYASSGRLATLGSTGEYIFCRNGVAATGKRVAVRELGYAAILKSAPPSC